MYLPRHFAVDDIDEIAAFVAQAGAADLVTFDGTKPIASLIPVIWERADAGSASLGRLLGHLALANPQWEVSRTDVAALAIVHGPQAYVSPSWYPTKAEHGRVVPTWNYSAAHLTGRVTFHRDPEWLRDLVTRLTDVHEMARADRWHVDDAPKAYVDAQLRGIVGVELAVESVEAKAKLSQNRSIADREGVIAGLRQQTDPGADAVAELMSAGLSRRDSRQG